MSNINNINNNNYQRISSNIPSGSPTLSESSNLSSNTLINIDDSDEQTLTNFDLYKNTEYIKTYQSINNKRSLKDVISSFKPSKETLKLGFLIIGWYCASALHSNFQKKVLKQYKHPFTITYLQFFSIVFYSGISHFLGFTEIKKTFKICSKTNFTIKFVPNSWSFIKYFCLIISIGKFCSNNKGFKSIIYY